jgi:putative FmdB family regulatory protein
LPTYEYACTACDERIEVTQSFADAPLEVCAVCGGKLRRVFHPVGVLFKGSGFYSTDSRSKKKTGEPAPPKNSDKSPKPSESKGQGDKSSGERSSGEKKAEGASTSPKPDSGGPARNSGE